MNTQRKTVWERGFEANPSALTIVVVEGARHGNYTAKYDRAGVRREQKRFEGPKASDEAHAFAELWNGPEADRAMYPERY